MFSILFISRSNSQDNSAYSHRLKQLQIGLKQLGVHTGFLYLGDRTITSHTMIPFYLPMLVRIFRQFDCIHAGGTPCAFVANLCKPFHGKKVIYDNHGDYISEIIQNIQAKPTKKITGYILLFKGFLQEVVATWFSDEYLAVSKPLKRLMKNRGIRNSNIHIIRNGVNLKLFAESQGKSNRNFVVAYAGLFQSYQAIDDFIEAGKILKNKNIRFQIIGFTPEDYHIKQSIKDQFDNKVDLIDNVSQDVLVQLLEKADVLVIPRKQSKVTAIAFPTKFAEYIALGKPVIVSDVDETADFVKKFQCGLIYRPGGKEFAKTILRMAEFSKKELQRMRHNGRLLAEQFFNWEIISKTYFHILKKKIR